MEGNATSKKLVGTVFSGYSMTGSVGTVFSKQAPTEIPTKVSAFENDAGYLTADALEGYALKTDIPAIGDYVAPVAEGYITQDDLNGYALKTEIPTVPINVSAFTNDAGYLTEKQVQKMIENAIANIQGGENENVVIISFSIEDYQFQAEEGMTWREWVNSEYNSDGACVYNAGEDTIRFVEYSLNVLSPSNAPVKGSDSIISGYFYYLS